MQSMSTYKDLFTSKGIKNTTPRQKIFALLQTQNKPQTAEQIHLKLSEESVCINLSTVYRVLELFVQKNLAQKSFTVSERKMYFMPIGKAHQHYLVCLTCSNKHPITHCPIKDLLKTLQKESNYNIHGHELMLYGYCPDCQKKHHN
jgi:Fur family transcriptional regulator, ferric uptake regulator